MCDFCELDLRQKVRNLAARPDISLIQNSFVSSIIHNESPMKDLDPNQSIDSLFGALNLNPEKIENSIDDKLL
jgi:hypothetical protein